MAIEERLMDIEVKIAFQDDTVQELSQLVYEQQKQLDQLETAFRSLAARWQELSESMSVPDEKDEKPPHY